jgi:hypothetical protein
MSRKYCYPLPVLAVKIEISAITLPKGVKSNHGTEFETHNFISNQKGGSI